MTSHELTLFVVTRWQADHCPTAIMFQLVCLGHPITKADVLRIVRKYVDRTTENNSQHPPLLTPLP